jgi:hypothetical protein
MPVIKKINPVLRKPLAKELMNYGVQNEVRRYVGKGKMVVPHFIPFVNNKQLDITDALKAQGIDASAYTGTAAQQFDTPAGIEIPSGAVRKIPLKTPQDSLFYMVSVRYWSTINLVDSEGDNIQFPVVGQNATLKSSYRIYDKWNKTNSTPLNYLTQGTFAGSVATPSARVTPPASISAFDTKTLHNGMVFVLPIYDDDVTDPTTKDPSSYKQVQISNMQNDGSYFDMKDMSGTAYTVKFSGEAPVFWPFQHGNSMAAMLPYHHFLKVALYANSPKKINIYGGFSQVPSLDDNRQGFDHIERLYASTLQGFNEGYNQMYRNYLFPIDSIINIEIENTFLNINATGYGKQLVNGYVFGFQIFDRSKYQ